MVVHRCDFCRKVFEKRLHSIYFETDLFNECYHERIREYIGMPCAVSFQGEDIFRFEICDDCFKDIGNIVLNCTNIDKNNGYETGD